MTSGTSGIDRVAMAASAVRFFWTEGGSLSPGRSYHWCVDCAWVLVAAWHGARVVASVTPPPDAARENVAFVHELLEKHLRGPAFSVDLRQWRPSAAGRDLRWLCEVCSQYVPRPVASDPATGDDSCLKCGCSQEMHVSCRGPFDHGCGMAWVDMEYGSPDLDSVRLIHCPCDGYEPPAGVGGDAIAGSRSAEPRREMSETLS